MSYVMYSVITVIFSVKGNFKICRFVNTKYEYKQEWCVTNIPKNCDNELYAR